MARRWSVYLDGDLDERFRTREAAREYAAWLRRHPACKDRRIFGRGGVVTVVDEAAPREDDY